jgi:hypothetical protein
MKQINVNNCKLQLRNTILETCLMTNLIYTNRTTRNIQGKFQHFFMLLYYSPTGIVA